MEKRSNYIILSAIACFIACIGEFATIFVLGEYYPGYKQMKDTMSALGASISPVGNLISTWWVIMGFLILFFGTGVRKTFPDKFFHTKLASWLIILYGLGEGIGSGAFKADHIANGLSNSAIIHDIVGGIGVTAILILPLIMLRVIPKNEDPDFYRMSKIIFVTGLLTVLLFMFRFSSGNTNFLTIYKGLWQRLFMLNTYIYFTTIAFIIIKRARTR